MNIGLCSLYPPFISYGGIELHVKELGENLIREGCGVFFVAYRKCKGEDNHFYLRYPLKGPLLFEKKFLYDIAINPFVLNNLISNMNLDLLHFEFLRGTLTGLLTKIRRKIPVVASMHNLPKAYLPKEMKHFGNLMHVRTHVSNLTYKVILKRVDAVVCPSQYVANIIEENYQRACFVIPNSIYVNKYFDLLPKDLAKGELGINKPAILFVGRLDKLKGLEYLIRAMPKILSQVNCELLVVGGGWMRPNLENFVQMLGLKEHVKFLGYVSGMRKLAYFAAADIFVCPSIFETFGIVNIEALASGLPIVASKVCSIPEIVQDGVNGFLVKPQNPDEIAEAVVRLLMNEKLRERMSTNNRKKAKGYDWSVTIKQFLNLYNELIS